MTNLTETIKLQQLASDPNNSSWVFASAGSGKTKVLTDRVLRMLLSGIAPEKILCLTFTKVAATEMQNRVNAELAQWVLIDEENLAKKLFDLSGTPASNADLKKARILFAEILDAEAKIKIQTIHSFCQNLVKIFPFEAGIKPNFEVLESSQEKLLLQKAQKEVLKKTATNSQLKNLVIKINSRLHETTFLELTSDLLSKKERLTILKENFFGIEGVIDEIFKNFAVTKNQSEEEIFEDFFNKINQQEVLKLAQALEESGLANNKKIAEKIRFFLQNPLPKKFTNYQLAFFTEKNEPRKIAGKVLDQANLFEIYDSQINLIFNFCDQLNSLKICNSTALLLKFVDSILEIYSALKYQNSFLDYNDLIIETNRLLANPNFSDWVKMKMDGLFDHILIDESQDTNHQQWNIVKALTEDFFSGLSLANKNRTIFIVGDEKQSIYSFQGAEPDISQEIFSYFAEKLQDHPVQFHKIDLNNSFRSLPTILDAVDATFGQEKEKSAISKVSDFKGHKAIREGIGRFEIWPQIKLKKAEKSQNKDVNYEWNFDFTPQENYYEQEFLAETIALKIKDWVESGRVLESRKRALKYSDFMILLRRRTDGFDKILNHYFHQNQIPVGGSNKVKFADSLIVQDLLCCAQFALSPQDDLNLAAILKSPIFGISEEDLLEICLFKNSHETTIYQALQQLPKFFATAEFLHDLRKKSVEVDCFEFFYFLLTQENRRKIISRFGAQSSEILDKFCLKVFDFCGNFSPNLQKFLEFVEKLNPEILLSHEESNQVLITTVHSAKGLQAPVVILPDCCFNTNQLRSTKEKISWIDFAENKMSLPIWCAPNDEENRLLKSARELKKRQAKDEYLRLLYVAMTRAEDELYVAGSGSTNDPECWYELIKRSVKTQWSKEMNIETGFQTSSRSEWSRSKENFDITGEVLGTGLETSQPPNLPLEGFCNSDNTFIKTKKEPNVEMDLQTPSRTKSRTSFNNSIILDRHSTQPKITSTPQIKGKLIHKILEIFGKNHAEEKVWLAQLAEKIIAREEFLSAEEKNKISREVSAFMASDQFEKLFCGNVKCEIEIAGNLEGQKILNRIDLLVEKENEILIVDYKSDETLPNQVPQHYKTQLETYKKLVKNLHPNKKINTAILWVKFLKLETF